MPDVYVSGSDNSGRRTKANKPETKRPRLLTLIDKQSPKYRYHPLASFMLWPKGIRVEVQDPHEDILLVARQHPIVNIRWMATALLMIILSGFFGLVPVYSGLPMRFQAMTLLLWYMLTTFVVLEGFLNWYFDAFVVTDERIIDIDFRNLIYKNITYTKIDNIEDVTYSVSGFLPSLLNYGNVLIQTAGPANFAGAFGPQPPSSQGPQAVVSGAAATVPTSEILNTPYPAKVVQLINELLLEEEQEKIEGRVR